MGSRPAFVALLVGIAFFGFVACYNGGTALTLNAVGVSAQARVVSVERGYQGGGTVTVEFPTRDGRVVRAECDGCSTDLDAGDRLVIRYDPDSPESGVEAVGNRDHQRVAVFALVVVLVLAAAAVVTGRRLLREARSG